jgi:hypothetical protein
MIGTLGFPAPKLKAMVARAAGSMRNEVVFIGVSVVIAFGFALPSI